MAHIWNDRLRTSDVEINENITFDKMILSDRVILGLTKNSFIYPSPIQLRALPLGICGLDLLLQAKSGTGKTLVFSIIVLENFQTAINSPQSLILTPTRELAVQIEEILKLIGSQSLGFSVNSFIGGLDIQDDRKRIQKCKSIVGTPGRIVHLIKSNILNTSNVNIIVLDEIDKLMNGSFVDDIDFIFKSLPVKKQVIGSSATYDKKLENKLMKFMKNPIGVTPKKEAPILIGVKQFIYKINGENDKPVKEMFAKIKAMISILSSISFKQCLVFSSSQQRAESYANYLTNEGWPCEVIMGSQEQSVRLAIFKRFKDFKFRILLATDLLSRGVDSENVNLVINLEVPTDGSLYLHRIGRCGRFGSHGIAITLVHTNDELTKFRKLLTTIGGSEMKVLKYPINDSSNIWDFSNPNSDAKLYGEICGEEQNGNVTEIVQKNLDLLEISKLLVDKPDNTVTTSYDEDLFDSYSNMNFCHNDTAAQTNTNDRNCDQHFIDAINRLNLLSNESNQTNKDQCDKSINCSSSHTGTLSDSQLCDVSTLDSDSDSTSTTSNTSKSESSCDDDLQCQNFEITNRTSNAKWNNQFLSQTRTIQNYVNHMKTFSNASRRYY